MDLPQRLINEIQNHTNMPWWNGAAYADFKGYPGQIRAYEDGVGDAVDDLADVIEWLRQGKQYAQADRLRTIAGRLAMLRPDDAKEAERKSLRWIARGWK